MFFNEEKQKLSYESQIWNEFISICVINDTSTLTKDQLPAALVFLYDTEMNSGGHSGYLDCYPEIDPEDLVNALHQIKADIFVENYKNALLYGQNDDYIQVDRNFGTYKPTLTEILQKYVISNFERLGITLS